jgi:hypothetical protein
MRTAPREQLTGSRAKPARQRSFRQIKPRYWTGVGFQWGTNFAIWHWWSHYADAVAQVYGPDQISGVFYAQGTINVEGSNLFADASPSWYKVR